MSGHKKTPNAKPLITFTLDEELLSKIEDYQFDNRIKNRSQAITKLVLQALEQQEQNKKSGESE